MIRVHKPEAIDNEEWRKIKQEAEMATQALKDAYIEGRKPKINDALYKKYMRFLLAIFYRKCAYCETPLAGQPGDVEHFRPKNRVSDIDRKVVYVIDPKTSRRVPHPGYFWLAYDWRNLLPACADCNRFRRHECDEGAGKADRFPVKRTHNPDWECNTEEEPLLIDPSMVDPDEHLQFAFDEDDRAIIQWLTDEGRHTIEVFGLNLREQVIELRKDAYNEALLALNAWIDAVKSHASALADRERQRINSMWRGEKSYAMARRAALRWAQKDFTDQGMPITLPLPEPVGPRRAPG